MKKVLANMFTFHKRTDGTYFGFGENAEGWLCYIGYMVTCCYVISHIVAAICVVTEKLETRKALRAKRKEKIKDITDNGPVENAEEDDVNKLDYKYWC